MRVRSSSLILLSLLLLGSGVIATAADWQIDQAPVRFSFRLTSAPSHDEAGYLVHIPDGGILPGPYPHTDVVTEGGKSVESYILWHGVEAGLWVVLADPGQEKMVDVYVSAAKTLQTWKPATGLRPSPLLVIDASESSLRQAHRFARMGNVGAKVHVQAKAGIRVAPLSIGGDDSGRPRPTSFYLHTYVDTTDPGKTWMAPFFQEGQNEVQVDGEKLVSAKRVDKWGGTGQWVDLDKGLHRVEMFSASKKSGPYNAESFKGHAYLTWKTPTMPASELGGTRKANQPDPGTPEWAARVIQEDEIVRSGKTRLVAATAKNGGPLAVFTMTASQNFWFEGEESLGIYTFQALEQGNPENTTYTWTFEHGAKTRGSEIKWLVPSQRERRVTLTAVSGNRKSTCSFAYVGFPTETDTSLESAFDRREFRYAMQTVLMAYPSKPDPCMKWGDAYWNNLIRTAEYGKGYPLLENLLGKRWRTAAAKLSPKDLRLLEEIFLDVVPRVNSARALKWVQAFSSFASSADRKAELKIREAEIHLIYLDQPEEAEKLLASVIRRGGEVGECALVRLGDFQLQQGELNKAAQIYADVQKRVRHKRQGETRSGDGNVASWKLGAIKDVAHSKNVASLIEAGEYLKAREALDRWERDFPISKISEDLILREAELYMELGDWKRARWLLEPYCRQVDASSYLPDSALALLQCMEKMKEPKDAIEETIAFLKKRLEFHPVAVELEDFMRTKAGPAPASSATITVRE